MRFLRGTNAAALALVFGLLQPLGVFAADKKLSLTGSSTVAPLALEIAKRFEQNNAGVRIDVQTGGSGRGLADARSGVADLGLVSRALKAEESDLQSFTIALDGIAIILHETNPVRVLSKEQIIAIYTGQIQNWKAVGGKDQPITVVNKAEGRSTLELFAQFFGLKNSQIKAQVVIGDNQQGIKTVAGNPGSIGYVSIGAAEFEIDNGVPIQMLPMNGVKPSTASVRDGSFPLSRPLNLVRKGPLTGLARQFVDYAQNPLVHDLVKEQYFVPVQR
ncbi:MAG: phosphate ABC transporter substrate-binding protein [Gammaproteobacteria bacterium]|uniref:phosphate ABC transporter substrate-binding protein n=1 Tax=Limnobacter sp. TaxID=2003368 RepID=UPI001D99FEB9|nr:phosphate ABC transporter substrate-binding protein [Limnobacter sp.]MBU0782785.1 phosphate ABC transporter substrate-binding protein [Gammaproteobacteria bacterium]MBU0849372.1 phosphate ABC transporter substrate-binding protein [Gammaproteobacteria bacterium]MBU1266523.1 phosphate ABC transporter substrate-binding protein [Gammaproteobacteria bacterium]MBU1527718.1 phosphate ABC transporter substrate-binding protein [Gammaproteobacteria bacterium]MBU1779607.1 phosphate ABC transporter sub